jgi:hypothetical protein
MIHHELPMFCRELPLEISYKMTMDRRSADLLPCHTLQRPAVFFGEGSHISVIYLLVTKHGNWTSIIYIEIIFPLNTSFLEDFQFLRLITRGYSGYSVWECTVGKMCRTSKKCDVIVWKNTPTLMLLGSGKHPKIHQNPKITLPYVTCCRRPLKVRL